MPIRIALMALVSLGMLAPLAADDLYVNNARGDDKFSGRPASSGGENAGAVRTINRALSLALPGDRIIVEKTEIPYRESLTLEGPRLSGTASGSFEIVSNGAILDGTGRVPDEAWEHFIGNVFRFQPDLKSYQQVYRDGRPLRRVPVVSNRMPELKPLQWALKDGWVYFCVEPGQTPDRYNLRHSVHQTGITLYHVDQIEITGLIVQGFQLDGINAHDGVERALIRRCTLRGNGRSGLSVGGSSQVRLDQCLVGSNGSSQIRSEGHSDVDITESRILESGSFGSGMVRTGGQISVDGQLIR